jgi:hypothetical protein
VAPQLLMRRIEAPFTRAIRCRTVDKRKSPLGGSQSAVMGPKVCGLCWRCRPGGSAVSDLGERADVAPAGVATPGEALAEMLEGIEQAERIISAKRRRLHEAGVACSSASISCAATVSNRKHH